MSEFYKYSASLSSGKEVGMDEYKGKLVLIVNTASKCGFTNQYEGLEELYQKYKDKGLVILGFPSNQFAKQEPGSDEEIASFCQLNYGVTFQIFKKVDVNGKDAIPLFKYLKKELTGLLGGKIKWNFTKFLIGTDGEPIKRFAPKFKPEDLVPEIEKHLK